MLPILILFSLIGLGIGVIMIINPVFAIEMQRSFYEKINPVRNFAISICVCGISNGVNWKIEPISKSLEIRNTRLMGYLLVVLLVALLFFVLTKKLLSP